MNLSVGSAQCQKKKKKKSVSESRKGTSQRMEEVLDMVRRRSERPGAVNVLSWPEDFECGCFS